MAEKLLSRGADADMSPTTALHIAAGHGNQRIMRYLIENGHQTVHDEDFAGHMPFHFACEAGDLDIIVWLHQQGADPNYDGNEIPPLVNACLRRQWALASQLVDLKDININATYEDGPSILHLVCGEEPLDDYRPWQGSRIRQSRSQEVQRARLLKKLLSLGADTTQENDAGQTVFHTACFNVDVMAIKLLLSTGSDPRALIGDNNMSPLLMVCSGPARSAKNLKRAIDVLVNAGAPVDQLLGKGQTALHAVCSGLYLAPSGGAATVPLRELMMSTRGEMWARRFPIETVTTLVEHGADINDSFFGVTALVGAFTTKDLDLCSHLLHLGAKVDAQQVLEMCKRAGLASDWPAGLIYLLDGSHKMTTDESAPRGPLQVLKDSIREGKFAFADVVVRHGIDDETRKSAFPEIYEGRWNAGKSAQELLELALREPTVGISVTTRRPRGCYARAQELGVDQRWCILVKNLLTAGADPHAQHLTDPSSRALDIAIQTVLESSTSGDATSDVATKIMDIMLKKRPIGQNTSLPRGNYFQSLFRLTAKDTAYVNNGSLARVVRLLLTHGEDPNALDNQGNNAMGMLCEACISANQRSPSRNLARVGNPYLLEVVNLLREAGTSDSFKNHKGISADDHWGSTLASASGRDWVGERTPHLHAGEYLGRVGQ